jgi:hypothetical protein
MHNPTKKSQHQFVYCVRVGFKLLGKTVRGFFWVSFAITLCFLIPHYKRNIKMMFLRCDTMCATINNRNELNINVIN